MSFPRQRTSGDFHVLTVSTGLLELWGSCVLELMFLWRRGQSRITRSACSGSVCFNELFIWGLCWVFIAAAPWLSQTVVHGPLVALVPLVVEH